MFKKREIPGNDVKFFFQDILSDYPVFYIVPKYFKLGDSLLRMLSRGMISIV